jgi:DNA-directed RNA polymerase sigma subunit (sigma70/sigma32)
MKTLNETFGSAASEDQLWSVLKQRLNGRAMQGTWQPADCILLLEAKFGLMGKPQQGTRLLAKQYHVSHNRIWQIQEEALAYLKETPLC